MNASDGTQGVTVLVTRRPKAARKEKFEAYLKGITQCAMKHQGHFGVSIFKPEEGKEGDYRIIFKFDSEENLALWEQSDERQKWHGVAEEVSETGTVEISTGLESWFTIPNQTGPVPHPPKYKMALVIWIGIFSLVTLLSLLLDPFLPRIFLLTAIVVLLMTYVVMPFLTSLLKKWLYQ